MDELDGIRIASPCTVDWNSMTGDERVRHCGACRKNVYDLSSMTRREAEALVLRTEGPVCVRFYRRADGTVLTADCPVGLRAVRRRMARLGAALAAAFLWIFAAGCSGSSKGSGPGQSQPIMGKPAMPHPDPGATMGEAVMGDVASPPPENR